MLHRENLVRDLAIGWGGVALFGLLYLLVSGFDWTTFALLVLVGAPLAGTVGGLRLWAVNRADRKHRESQAREGKTKQSSQVGSRR